jgi:methionyl-tRNA synthetase
MLSFAYKRFDARVPEPGELDDEDRALLDKVEAGFQAIGALYNACRFRAALGEALALAREANGYLGRKAPASRSRRIRRQRRTPCMSRRACASSTT